jgi:hypothetical protein
MRQFDMLASKRPLDGNNVIRAYSTLLIIQKLMTVIQEIEKSASEPVPADYFDYITGTGTGG